MKDKATSPLDPAEWLTPLSIAGAFFAAALVIGAYAGSDPPPLRDTLADIELPMPAASRDEPVVGPPRPPAHDAAERDETEGAVCLSDGGGAFEAPEC